VTSKGDESIAIMRVLTINWTNRKDTSTGGIIASISEHLMETGGFEFLHCFEVGVQRNKNDYLISPSVVQKVEYKMAFYTGKWYGNGSFYTKRLCRRIKKYKPEIVHIHCPNSKSVNLYLLLDFLKREKYPVIITNHAEFFYTGNCSYAENCKGYLTGCDECIDYKEKTQTFLFNRTAWQWKKMMESFKGFDSLYLVAVSPWQENRIKTSTILSGYSVRTIINGIDVSIFRKKGIDTVDALKRKYVGKTVLTVTSLFSDKKNDLKGGHWIIHLAKEIPLVNFVVVGNIAKEMPELPHNIYYEGYISDSSRLADYYSFADILLMVSKRETFGMTVAESLCCGTPVVGFKNGGSETVTIPEYSEFIDYGDVEGLKELIIKWTECDVDREKISESARMRFSRQNMANEYMKLYEEIRRD